MGNELRAYAFYIEKNGKQPTVFITTQNMLEAFRPILGTQLTLPQTRKLYQVVRIEPNSNPTGQTNEYYVVELGTPAAPLRFTSMDSFGM